LTTTMVRNASGTVNTAGCASRACQSGGSTPAAAGSTAANARPPPSRMPAAAPASVNPRHQMPNTSSGQNDEAATAKASPTPWARSSDETASMNASGTDQAAIVAARKPRSRPGSTSVDSTPATLSTSPVAAETNAANAPAAINPPSSSPGTVWMPSAAPGRSSSAASVLPSASSRGTYSRASQPDTIGNR